MIVYKLTLKQKAQIEGVEFVEDNSYSPTLDGNGDWFISKEEVEQTTEEIFKWVKDLPKCEYVPIKFKEQKG